jgi:hypothetical protein
MGFLAFPLPATTATGSWPSAAPRIWPAGGGTHRACWSTLRQGGIRVVLAQQRDPAVDIFARKTLASPIDYRQGLRSGALLTCPLRTRLGQKRQK